MPRTVLNIAHRGASVEAPENTLAAFGRALELGADGFELDVHQTKDGELVVVHDDTVDRTTNGNGPVHEMTLSQLQSLDAGSWFNRIYPDKARSSFAGERIPTLQQVMDLVKGKPVRLCIEIKTGASSKVGLEEKVVELIGRNKLQDQVVVVSFDQASVKRIKQLNPNLKTTVLFECKPLDPCLDAKAVEADGIGPFWSFVTSDLVAAAHRNGLGVFVWTVNDPAAMRQMIAHGVDAILTDRPDLLGRILSE